MITIPSTLTTDLVLMTKDTLDVLWPVLVVLISVPLSFYILKRIYSLIPKR